MARRDTQTRDMLCYLEEQRQVQAEGFQAWADRAAALLAELAGAEPVEIAEEAETFAARAAAILAQRPAA